MPPSSMMAAKGGGMSMARSPAAKLKPAFSNETNEKFSSANSSKRGQPTVEQKMQQIQNQDPSAGLKWQRGPFAPCTRLATNDSFENIILVVIMLNAIWIGVDMELNKSEDLYICLNAFELFSFVENVFCLIFVFEITVRWFQYKLPLYFFSDPEMYHWNWFDFVLVGLMVMETWIFESPFAPFDVDKHRKNAEEGAAKAQSSFSQFRMLRLLRISRMVRVLRMVPELGMMVKSMVAATRGVASTMFLATGLLYVFSVIFTQWGQDHENPNINKRFGHLGESMLSFVQVMVYDDAFSVVRDTFKADGLMGFLILVFVLIGAFTVLNMLIGVIVEIVQDTQKHELEYMLLQKVADAFTELDKDGSGVVSREEFAADLSVVEKCGIDVDTVQLALELMDDDAVDLMEFVDLVFKLLRPISSMDIIQLSQGVAQLAKSQGIEPSAAVVTMDIRRMNNHGDMLPGPSAPSAAAQKAQAEAKQISAAAALEVGNMAYDSDEEEAHMAVQMENNFMAMVEGAEVTSDTETAMVPISSFAGASTQSAWESSAASAGQIAAEAAETKATDGANQNNSAEEISAAMLRPPPNFFAYHVRTEWFPNVILFIICLNALWIGMEIEFNDPMFNWGDGVFGVADGPFHGWSPYMLVEQIFCVIFTYEILVRVLAYKKLKYFWTDPVVWYWNWFDAVLVSLMIFENWLIHFLPGVGGANVSMFSIFRMLRLLRISRILRSFPELATMVKSLTAAARSVGSTLALMMGLIYVFAIIFTQWGTKAKSVEIQEDYFGDLFHASITLLQMLVFDDAVAIVRTTLEESKFMGMLLLAFMCLGSFTVLNMLIGVICEIVSATKAAEEERIMRIRCKELFSQFDEDLSGTISREEYESRKDLIASIGLSPETCRLAFDLGDQEDTGQLALNDFIGMCFKLVKPPEAHDLLLIKRNLKKIAVGLGDASLINLFGRGKSSVNLPGMEQAMGAANKQEQANAAAVKGSKINPMKRTATALPGAMPQPITITDSPSARNANEEDF